MGWPTADATTVTSQGKKGVVQTFQTGVATVQGTARTVTGAIGANYVSHGGPSGVLGWPTSVSTSPRRTAAAGPSDSPGGPSSRALGQARTRSPPVPCSRSTTHAAGWAARSAG